MDLKEKLKMLPEKPGVYIMRNAAQEIIYIGKAVSLKNRVRSYFQNPKNQLPKVRAMVQHIDDFEYILTDSELEALILECNLIKKHRPKYNILLKDDKHYPYLKITTNEDYPRILVVRQISKDGAKYFGPYPNRGAVNETVDLLKLLFPIRSCKRNNFNNASRPCLNYHIKRCLAPCSGNITKEAYLQMVKEIIAFLDGKTDIINVLQAKMEEAAAAMDFERAAQLRDKIMAVQQVIAKQKIISTALNDQDVIAFARNQGETCIQVFFIRGGKLIGREHFMLDDTAELAQQEIMTEFIKRYYTNTSFVPREIILQHEIDELQIIEGWLRNKRGANVYIRIPQKGEKKELVEMVAKNASAVLEQFMVQHAKTKLQTTEAVKELQQWLSLEQPPIRIEAYDISNIQGTEAVGSMVVFENGMPKKEDYRRFKIKTVEGPNDFAMMAEVIRRRFAHGLKEKEIILNDDFVPEQLRFASFPDLILIDGGKGQLHSAREELYNLKLDYLPTIGLAKEFEYVFTEDSPDPIIIPRDSEALFLLQRVRDEAHRFAITYHRQLRSKRTFTSSLDEIAGIGKQRRNSLLKHFGSVGASRSVGAKSCDSFIKIPTSRYLFS